MDHDGFSHGRCRQLAVSGLLSIALLAGILLQSQALSQESERRLQGIFCNTEGQIDKIAAHLAMRLPPRAAVELANKHGVVCNYVDLIHYVVENPSMIGAVGSYVRLFKYEATLKAVIVGNAVREVRPPARIFFVTSEALAGVPAEERA